MDLTNKTFGRLRVIEYNDIIYRASGSYFHSWKCICSCGNECLASSQSLLSGGKQSCGCLNKEILASGDCRRKHGKAGTRIYKIWASMKDRCKNPNNAKFDRYGGRGIDICAGWETFEIFYNWAIQNGYEENLTIDRIDNDGNYEPDNCRWVDMVVQANNKSNNHLLTIGGETHTISEWSRITGLNPRLISERANRGCSPEEILNKNYKKIVRGQLFKYHGVEYTIKELSEKYGISETTLSKRINSGMSVDEAIQKPIRKVVKKRMITFNGETHSVTEWSKITGINRETLFARIREGWSVENMLTKPLQQGKKGM